MNDLDARRQETPKPLAEGADGLSPRAHWSFARALGSTGLGIIVAVLIFLVFEGLCSVVLAVRDLGKRPVLADKSYERYDSELGWTNIPNLYIPAMFGPSRYVRSNSLGYRSNREFEQHVPAGKVRMLCSGDSFTFGYGVSNDEAWCQVLESLDHRIESVNMGVSGYGADQMYLAFRHEVDRLDADVHMVAIIGDDILRMHSDRFLGFGKPVLRLEGDRLAPADVPVPKDLWQKKSITVAQDLNRVRSIEVMSKLIQRVAALGNRSGRSSQDLSAAEERRIILRMLESYRDLDKSRNRVFVFIYLPVRSECYSTQGSEEFRQWLASETRARGIAFIDMVPEFRALPVIEAGRMFIQQNVGNYYGASGHYSVAGNKFVAERVYSRLMSDPEIRRRIDGISSR